MEQEKQETTQEEALQQNVAGTADASPDQNGRTEADDYADIKNRTAEVIETTARERRSRRIRGRIRRLLRRSSPLNSRRRHFRSCRRRAIF